MEDGARACKPGHLACRTPGRGQQATRPLFAGLPPQGGATECPLVPLGLYPRAASAGQAGFGVPEPNSVCACSSRGLTLGMTGRPAV